MFQATALPYRVGSSSAEVYLVLGGRHLLRKLWHTRKISFFGSDCSGLQSQLSYLLVATPQTSYLISLNLTFFTYKTRKLMLYKIVVRI